MSPLLSLLLFFSAQSLLSLEYLPPLSSCIPLIDFSRSQERARYRSLVPEGGIDMEMLYSVCWERRNDNLMLNLCVLIFVEDDYFCTFYFTL